MGNECFRENSITPKGIRMCPFNQNQYWLDRHSKLRDDPRSIYRIDSTDEQIMESERVGRDVMLQCIRIIKPTAKVLDIGCGIGRIAPLYLDAGLQYTGIDVSPVAIETAKSICPNGRFLVGSALDIDTNQLERYDLACVLHVFMHFVDDNHWSELIRRISGHLNIGGGLLFADLFPVETIRPAQHVALRPIETYREEFDMCGLELDDEFSTALRAACGAHAEQFRYARKVR